MHLNPLPCCDITASYLSFTLTCSLSLLCLLPVPCFDCSMSFTLTATCFFTVTAPCPLLCLLLHVLYPDCYLFFLLWLLPVLYCDWFLSFIVDVMIPVFVCVCYLVVLQVFFLSFFNIGSLSLRASSFLFPYRYMLRYVAVSAFGFMQVCCCPWVCLRHALVGAFSLVGVYALFLLVSALCFRLCLRSVFVGVYALFLLLSMLCSCWCLRSVLVSVYALFLSMSSCLCLCSVLVGAFALISCQCLCSVFVGVYALFSSVSTLCSCCCLQSVLVGV
jgi:hypothetical protein